MFKVNSIRIVGGYDKNGKKENLDELVIKRGEILGIVGPTGSGKSTLLDDIEQIAQNDTFSGRKVLLDDKVPTFNERFNPRKRMIAQLSQKMNFLADMTVREFILLHCKSRRLRRKNVVEEVVKLANTLTGEPLTPEQNLTILSGGQSRALMVADISVISDSPVVLIDEIENAGIKKKEAMDTLLGHGKIVIIVTHDPVLALMARKRIIMKSGGIQRIIDSTDKDRRISERLSEIDNMMSEMREHIRNGDELNMSDEELSEKTIK